ncbi:MAG: DUF6178 family protein [Thermodesulfobacteriota bacterium]
MTDRMLPLDIRARLARLREKRTEILGMPPEKALNAILEAEEPLPLVHSFAEEDFYFLVHDIGPADSLPLLALASGRQWEYLLDLEIWQKDGISQSNLITWLSLLMQADSGRLTAWLRDEKTDLLEYCLHRNVSVIMREHDQDPADFGDEYATFDDVYYFRILDAAGDPEAGGLDEGRRYEFLAAMLAQLAETDFVKYQQILVESTTLLPAETEEELYRWRNIRLAEKGFLPFEEALGVYQPLGRDELAAFRGKPVVKKDRGLIPFSLSPAVLLRGEDPFGRAVRSLKTAAAVEQVQIELAALCNRLMAADQVVARERETLGRMVAKASGYLSLGLQRLMEEEGREATDELAAGLILNHSLTDIFRIGYDRVVKLKDRADKWRKNSWYAGAGLPLSFWGEHRVGVIGGLMIKKPLYFDAFRTGVLYREFQTGNDLRETDAVLREVAALDRLLSLLIPVVPAALAGRGPAWDSLLLTLWAGARLGLAEKAPVPFPRFKLFFQELLPPAGPAADSGGKAKGGTGTRRIPPAMKQAFLVWLGRETGLAEKELLADLGATFDKLFADMENEYAAVAAESLDPRYIHLFLLE